MFLLPILSQKSMQPAHTIFSTMLLWHDFHDRYFCGFGHHCHKKHRSLHFPMTEWKNRFHRCLSILRRTVEGSQAPLNHTCTPSRDCEEGCFVCRKSPLRLDSSHCQRPPIVTSGHSYTQWDAGIKGGALVVSHVWACRIAEKVVQNKGSNTFLQGHDEHHASLLQRNEATRARLPNRACQDRIRTQILINIRVRMFVSII